MLSWSPSEHSRLPQAYPMVHTSTLESTVVRSLPKVIRTALLQHPLPSCPAIRALLVGPAAITPHGTTAPLMTWHGDDVAGANVIPAHIFATEEWRTPDRWRWLLQQAASANFNMIRVWGRGSHTVPDSPRHPVLSPH